MCTLKITVTGENSCLSISQGKIFSVIYICVCVCILLSYTLVLVRQRSLKTQSSVSTTGTFLRNFCRNYVCFHYRKQDLNKLPGPFFTPRKVPARWGSYFSKYQELYGWLLHLNISQVYPAFYFSPL